jgi:hypothetical protein
MTDQAPYQPLPMPHGRLRPAPPPLLVLQGTLPPALVEQARARHAEAEVLLLPREAEAYLQDGDSSLAIYNDSDMVTVEVLRRGGRLSRSPWNFGGGPILDQAASSLVGVTATAMVWSRVARRAGRYR